MSTPQQEFSDALFYEYLRALGHSNYDILKMSNEEIQEHANDFRTHLANGEDPIDAANKQRKTRQ